METMYHANGISLTATQIAIDKRLIVVDCGKTKFETWIYQKNIMQKLRMNILNLFQLK